MKKVIIVVLSLSLACGCLFAQNTGYMGRHVLVNGEISLSPAYLKPNPLGEALSGKVKSQSALNYLGMNYIVSPNVEVIVWQKGSVGAGYNFYKSPFTYKQYFQLPASHPEYTYYDNSIYLEGKADMTAHGFNVFYKQYVGKTRAPMGHFFKFTFDGFFYQYKVRQEEMLLALYEDLESQRTGKNMLFGLKVEYGYDYLLCDFLRLSMGVSLGTTFGGYKALSYRNSVFGEDLQMQNFANNRLLGAYWFGIKLGVGFLTF